MKELLTELSKDEFEVIIISDSNSEFIKTILDAAGLGSVVHTSYTNPAHWDEDGCLRINFYHVQDWCKLSTQNLCKGHILDAHIDEALKQRDVRFSNVVYVGDGKNDLCPSLRLRECDVTCPRKGFYLERAITELEAGKLKCQVLPWDSGHVILQHIMELPGAQQ